MSNVLNIYIRSTAANNSSLGEMRSPLCAAQLGQKRKQVCTNQLGKSVSQNFSANLSHKPVRTFAQSAPRKVRLVHGSASVFQGSPFAKHVTRLKVTYWLL